jgi:uncharacterized membrane protein
MEPNAYQTTSEGSGTNPQVTKPSTPSTSTKAENTTLMGVLAYIGILVIIPYLMAKNDPFVKFHIKQGLVLVVIEIVVMIAAQMVYMLAPILGLIHIAALILSIIGIVNVVQKKQVSLPLIGQFSKHFDTI